MKKSDNISFSRRKMIITYMIMTMLSIPILGMYLWLTVNSFADYSNGSNSIKFTLKNWAFLWGEIKIAGRVIPPIWSAFFNSIIFAVTIMFIEITISSLAGYTLSRMVFKGRQTILRSIILLHAFPSVSLLIAVFYVLSYVGLIDTLTGVILVKAALQIPMSTYIIKGFFDEVPWDVEWSALVDGCSRIKALIQVVFPHVKAGIAAISIFSLLAGWSEFILLYTFLFGDNNILLSTYLKKMMGEDGILNYGVISAVGVFYMIPILVFFVVTQKSLMKINVGGGKGV